MGLYVKKIDLAGAAGLLACSGQAFPSAEGIDNTGFSSVGSTGKGDFSARIGGQLG